MFKNILMFSALTCGSILADKGNVEKESTRPKSIFGLMEDFSRKMQDALDEEFHKIDSRFKEKKAIGSKVEVAENDNYVIIKIEVPNITEKGVKIDAKKTKLKGELSTTDGGSIRFSVLDGKSISVSSNLKKQIEDSKDKDKSVRLFSSHSSNYFTLPAKVSKLEETNVELKDSTLTLSLPKAESNWKKIEVK